MAVNKGYEFEDENSFSEKNFSHSDSQLSSIEHKTGGPSGDQLQEVRVRTIGNDFNS